MLEQIHREYEQARVNRMMARLKLEVRLERIIEVAQRLLVLIRKNGGENISTNTK
jgi:hypothetical protein